MHYTCTGAIYIKKMLMRNKKLKHLDIGWNKICDDGVRYVTEGLQQNDILTVLVLYNCEMSVKGKQLCVYTCNYVASYSNL